MSTKALGTTKTVPVVNLRKNMADILNRIAYRGDRYIVNRRGKLSAAIVSMDDLKIIESFEGDGRGQKAERGQQELRES